ncbi:MAG: mandelate racemase/muconate lactonizing enzyme family protein [Candidatus Solibacter usitatus]|nr:mandelate racemase/muconate lactonizing enzyme family protein [Candidatus Solibacter usitatus]
MNRRHFLSATAAAWWQAAGQSYGTSTAPGAVPEWEADLFGLERHSKTPVTARIELLKAGRSYFVRATSKEGVQGIARVKQIEDYLPMLTRVAMPFFAGKDVRRLETLMDEFYIRNYKLAGQALWAPAAYVEQALFDLYGKTVGKSVGALLGGVKRTQIPVYLSGSGRETTAEEEVAVYQRGLAETGARAVKFKIGGRMSRNADAYPGRTEKMLELARKTYGDKVVIYADANGSYNAAKAIEVGKLLAGLKCGFFEEPCPWEEISETKRVADALSMPIAGGEQDSSFWKFSHMIGTRTLDIVQPDLNYNGGFIRAARVARMAARAGIPITPHNTQTGVTSCYILQFASAIPNVGPYMEYPYRGKYENEPWHSPQFVIRDGTIAVPEGPGLGVEIDPAYLAKAAVVSTAGG